PLGGQGPHSKRVTSDHLADVDHFVQAMDGLLPLPLPFGPPHTFMTTHSHSADLECIVSQDPVSAFAAVPCPLRESVPGGPAGACLRRTSIQPFLGGPPTPEDPRPSVSSGSAVADPSET